MLNLALLFGIRLTNGGKMKRFRQFFCTINIFRFPFRSPILFILETFDVCFTKRSIWTGFLIKESEGMIDFIFRASLVIILVGTNFLMVNYLIFCISIDNITKLYLCILFIKCNNISYRLGSFISF